MHFKNLLKISCIILPCFIIIPVKAQNVNAKPADTTKVSYGYGEQDKRNVTGAVSVLPPGNFNKGAIFNPADQLAGKVSGVTITQPGGDPNQTASVSIRGQSSFFGNLSPLFVVDGVILDDASEFQNIPPGEIVSYTVLKDAASTAIYGLRGTNGVIIVTTKKGEKGHPTVS
ncbi:MAG TPA: TonB-dependent receptor plug domain-containing protein, partial [Mucilaginibacter sp.]|nr:TonB-dependent receptor plug domain-containing protein [Mucilaginibacter sp.]